MAIMAQLDKIWLSKKARLHTRFWRVIGPKAYLQLCNLLIMGMGR